MRISILCILTLITCAVQSMGFNVVIDGVLDEGMYAAVTPLKSAISLLYLIPMSDALYIGAEVEDASIMVDDPQQFWNSSCVEVWFDWANDNSPALDENDREGGDDLSLAVLGVDARAVDLAGDLHRREVDRVVCRASACRGRCLAAGGRGLGAHQGGEEGEREDDAADEGGDRD